MQQPDSTESPSRSLPRRILHPATLLSFGVAILLLLALARGTDINISAMAEAIRGSNPILLVLAFVVYYLNFPIRGLRWKILAQNAERATQNAAAPPLPSTRAFGESVFLGWFVNAVSWLRMGDPYRAYLITRQREGASYPAMLGTLVSERVIDLISFAVLLLISGALLWAGEDRLSVAAPALAVALAGGGVLVLAAMALAGERATRRLPAPIRDRYQRLRAGALTSLQGRLPAIAGLSAAAWATEGARLLLVTSALGLTAPLPTIAFVALAHNLITAIPATPGGLGLAEAGMVGLLILWLPVDDAAALTALDRSITWLSVVLIGAIIFTWREAIRRGRL